MPGAFEDCLVKYGALSYGQGYSTVESPPISPVLSPWVKVVFRVSGNYITVGNNSAPQVENTACIRDFELGFSETLKSRISIVDQKGGSFVTFMENILMDSRTINPENMYMVEISFGWTTSTCNEQSGFEKSRTHYGIINNCVCNFESGQCIFQVEVTGLMERSTDFRIDEVYGTNENEVFFTDAVRQLLVDNECSPRVANVAFKSIQPNGELTDLKFGGKDLGSNNEADETKGPKGIWRCNNLDKLNVIQQWCSQIVTKDGKGVIPKTDPTTLGETFYILEDAKPTKDQNLNGVQPKGVYVVNGGNSSPVISFNPSYQFQFGIGASSGGTMGTAGVTSNVQTASKNPGHEDVNLGRSNNKCMGAEVSNTLVENFQNAYGREGEQKTQEAADKQLLAYSDMTATESISADLVIIGDPKINPLDYLSRFVSVIVLNPFYLRPRADGPNWVVSPPCNDVVSNKAWLVKGINHQISGGKYTTTLQLFLAAPGVHLPIGQGLGGGGWAPPNSNGTPAGSVQSAVPGLFGPGGILA